MTGPGPRPDANNDLKPYCTEARDLFLIEARNETVSHNCNNMNVEPSIKSLLDISHDDMDHIASSLLKYFDSDDDGFVHFDGKLCKLPFILVFTSMVIPPNQIVSCRFLHFDKATAVCPTNCTRCWHGEGIPCSQGAEKCYGCRECWYQ